MAEPEVQPEQQEIDYSEETAEQLEARMMAGEGLVTVQEDVPEPTPEPAVEVTETPAEKVAAEETPAEETPAVEAKEEEEKEPEFDERESYVEELKLEVEKARAQSARDQVLQQRDSGRVGALNLQVQRLEQALAGLQQNPDGAVDPYAGQPQPPVTQPGDPATQSRLVELEQSARARAIAEVQSEFLQGTGLSNDDGQALFVELGPSMMEQLEPYREEIPHMRPDSLKRVVRSVLDAAYANNRLAKLQEARKAALERKASQVPERKQAKTAATVSGSGGTPTPVARPKRPEEMTAEEADKALIQEFGDGHHKLRRG